MIKRPRINSIDFQIIHPEYSNLDTKFYSANNTDISMLQGSILQLDAITNKEIQYAWILIDDIKTQLYSDGIHINGEIQIDNDSKISLMCEDYNQIQILILQQIESILSLITNLKYLLKILKLSL